VDEAAPQLVGRLVRIGGPAAREELRGSATDDNDHKSEASDKPLPPSLQNLAQTQDEPTDGEIERQHPEDEQRDQRTEAYRVRPLLGRMPERMRLERTLDKTGQPVQYDDQRPCGDEHRRSEARSSGDQRDVSTAYSGPSMRK